MKRVYLLRHAESDSSRPPADRLGNPLTENGRRQAQLVAERLSGESFDLIIITPTHRSRETSNIINQRMNIPAIECELFQEKHPIRESMEAVTKRAREAMNFVEHRSEQCILIVSHGDFLQCLAHQILQRGSSKIHDEDIVGCHHTGLSRCSFNPQTTEWILESWDDRLHLT